MSVLTQDEKKKVELAVKAAESKTSGEIVVCCVAQSGTYRWVNGASVLLGWVLGSSILFFPHPHDWHPSAWTLLFWQLSAAAVSIVLSQIPFIRRLWVRKAELARRVHSSAAHLFIEAGIVNTEDRDGVLIYVSEFEHRVEIIADQGIHKVLGASYWKEQVDLIVKGIRERHACDAICEAVKQIGEKLEARFPRKAGDKNELPDRPL